MVSDCSSVATYFETNGLFGFSVAPRFVYLIVSFSKEKEKKSRGRMREKAKYKNKLAQRDESEISKDCMVRDE